MISNLSSILIVLIWFGDSVWNKAVFGVVDPYFFICSLPCFCVDNRMETIPKVDDDWSTWSANFEQDEMVLKENVAIKKDIINHNMG